MIEQKCPNTYHEHHRFSFYLQTLSTFLSTYFWVPQVPQILILSTNTLNFSLNLFLSTTNTTDSHSICKTVSTFLSIYFWVPRVPQILILSTNSLNFSPNLFLSTTSTTESHSVYKQSQLFSQFIFEYHEYHRFSFCLQTVSTFLSIYFWVPRVPQILILSTNTLNFSPNLFFEYHEYHRFSFCLQTVSTFLYLFWVPRVPQILILSTNTLKLFSQLIFEYHEYHRISFCLQTVSTFLSIYFWVPRVPQILILSTNSLNFSLNLFLSTTSTTDSHSIYKQSQLFSQFIFEYHEYHRFSFYLQTVSTFLSIYFWVPRNHRLRMRICGTRGTQK